MTTKIKRWDDLYRYGILPRPGESLDSPLAFRRCDRRVRDSYAVSSTADRASVWFGCSYAEVLHLNGHKLRNTRETLAQQYSSQRRDAKRRGIGWEFTFPAWVAAWLESGKLHLRGVRGDDYVMARRGDTGPYAPDNVFFTTSRGTALDIPLPHVV